MLSEQEKQHIAERVQLELDLKQRLARDDSPRKPPTERLWEALNGGFILLVVGSVVSAIIVPRLQYSQQAYEWKRQIEADNVKFKLGMMRQCYQEFSNAASVHAEVVAVGRQIDSPDRLSADE